MQHDPIERGVSAKCAVFEGRHACDTYTMRVTELRYMNDTAAYAKTLVIHIITCWLLISVNNYAKL
jgi:hypothetical protein